jgi:hypothetical protein
MTQRIAAVSAAILARQFDGKLRSGSPGWKQRAEEIVIVRILNSIPVHILPPASAKISGLARTELGLPVRDELELTLHRQGILHHERIVVQALTSDEHNTRRARTETRWGSRRAVSR